MATTTFESLVPEILPLMPDCTDMLIIRALRRASEELLTRSLIWRVDLDEHYAITGLRDLELELPKRDLRVVQLKTVKIDDKPLRQVGDGEFTTNYSGKTCSLSDFGRALRFIPPPTQSGSVQIRVILTTSAKSTGLEERVADMIHEPLLDGALSRLYSMPSMPWTNNPLAAFHAATFDNAIDKLRGAAENNGGRAVGKMKYGGY